MSKTDELLERLRTQQPVLSDPDELTAHILDNLPPQEILPKCEPVAMLVLRVVSTLAAVWLVGLFLYVNMPTISAPQTANEVPHYHNSTLSQGGTLEAVYQRHQRQDKQISYNQIRKMLYENK